MRCVKSVYSCNFFPSGGDQQDSVLVSVRKYSGGGNFTSIIDEINVPDLKARTGRDEVVEVI